MIITSGRCLLNVRRVKYFWTRGTTVLTPSTFSRVLTMRVSKKRSWSATISKAARPATLSYMSL